MRCDKKTLAVQWHITDQCQKKCIHCYIGERPNVEMSYLQIRNILSNLLEFSTTYNYCYEFYITGGDPLLHTNSIEVFKLFQEKGLSYSIMCNPESINADVLYRLESVGVKTIQLSMDGMEDNHDFVRGRGAFKRLISAVKMIKETKIKVALMYTLYEFNAEDLFNAMKIANDLDIDRFSFDLGISIGNAEKSQLKMINSLHLIKTLNCYLEVKKEIKRQGTHTFYEEKCNLLNAIRISQGEFCCPDEDTAVIFDGCQIGVNNFVIDVDGDVLGCRRLGKTSYCGNLFENSLDEIWFKSAFLEQQRKKIIEKSSCKKCSAHNWCQGCEAYEQALFKQGEGYIHQPLCGNNLDLSNKYILYTRTLYENRYIYIVK